MHQEVFLSLIPLKEDKILKILTGTKKATVQNNALCFLAGDRSPKQTAGSGLLGKIQNQLKKNGKLYTALRRVIGPVFVNPAFRKQCRELVGRFDETCVILHLGSGPTHYLHRKDIINIDLFAFDEVDLVADASNLPIESESADLVITFAMLEHAEKPHKIIDEIFRVTKQGGQIICYLPFMVPYHAAPDDFYRWSSSGLRILFSQFNEIEIMPGGGPTSALLWVIQEWLSILLSFGNKTLHDIIFIALMLTTSPLKLLDFYMVRVSGAEKIASGFAVIGKK